MDFVCKNVTVGDGNRDPLERTNAIECFANDDVR